MGATHSGGGPICPEGAKHSPGQFREISKKRRKNEENEPNLSFLAQTVQKWRPFEIEN
jgi:hypothetical protein